MHLGAIQNALVANPDLHAVWMRLGETDALVRTLDNERREMLTRLRADAAEADSRGECDRAEVARWLAGGLAGVVE